MDATTISTELTNKVESLVQNIPLPIELGIGTTIGLMGIAGIFVLNFLKENVEEEEFEDISPYPRGIYDRDSASAYFRKRPGRVLSRLMEITQPGLTLGFRVLRRGSARDEEKLAKDIVDAIAELGPTFIKVGQALSIRSDLLEPVYCRALSTLQDSVPPYDTNEAKQLILEELKLDSLDSVFVGDFPKETIASASLGQVYKCRVKRSVARPWGNGDLKISNKDTEEATEVAVKVQRPNVEETIALDLFILRTITPTIKKLFRLNTDLPGLVDTWGERFVDELDYRKEANNAALFMQSILRTPLAHSVFAPSVIPACSSGRVLTTEWIEGTRLDRLSGPQVLKFCSVALNAYLTMLLESTTLHADPHPGNFVVSPDGRLAILDWGLVTSLEPGLQLAYIDHIAHLVSKDYAKVPQDLVKLGFVPPGMEKEATNSDAVKVLTQVYTQFGAGGGAKKIDVNAVVDSLRGLADRQGNIFVLPAYFAYIARTFSVLEGIGLSHDPDYAIVQECLPYISQRLITDSDPRVASALETFIYGKTKSDTKTVDAKRVEYLLDGISSFNAAASSPLDTDESLEEKSLQVDEIVATFKQAAAVLLAENANSQGPSPTQAIVEREFAKLVGATIRQTASTVREQPAALAVARLLDPFGLLEPLARGKLFEPSEEDLNSLAVFQRIQSKANPQFSSVLDAFTKLSPQQQTQALREIADTLWQYRSGTAMAARRTVTELAAQTADRLLSPSPSSFAPPPKVSSAADPMNK
eukprot:CAMPEP_0197316730 /NCGR_PEP_ID=MMETSP0891-20130614/43858_1 /TAXON_ID=44058 ORGANISM="Aureoumbra lagunensis, Strain CCMP1510" /NCGR_SAMPLE_ID=MMETSP0891 /ASSEMBLY_ACC=CAM_ASM_000534 /LENGTH=756 /DNA_ID=CAMNT_0042806341 /DNA_START=125 /DNA_END=2395 /DNA_ORIENTATION=+